MKRKCCILPLFTILICLLGCSATDRYLRRATPEIRDTYYELRPLLTDKEALEFLELSRVEREEWLRKFWKSKDPTPTTERNEFKEEHEKRVEYAKDNFGSSFTMRPWDDRGEVYIKYGEPDEREIGIYQISDRKGYIGRENTDFILGAEAAPNFGYAGLENPDRGEIWHYYQHNLSLQFEDYRKIGYFYLVPYISETDAIRKEFIHEATDRLQSFYATKAEKVDMQKEIYKHDYGGEPLDYALDVASFRFKKDLYDVDVNVGIPTNKLRQSENDTTAQGSLMRRISVFDENLVEVAKDSTTTYYSTTSSKEMLLVDQKTFHLTPGEYTIAVEVKDLTTNRIGIYKKEIVLPAHTDLKEQYISQIIMAAEIRPPQPNEKKYVKHDLAIVPLPSKTYYADQMIKFYYEVYNLKLDNEGEARYLLSYDLVNTKKKKEENIFNSYVLTAKSPDIYEVGYIDPAEISAGDYILVARVQDALSGKIMKSVSPFCVLETKKRGEKE